MKFIRMIVLVGGSLALAPTAAFADIASSRIPCTPDQSQAIEAALVKAKSGLSSTIAALKAGSTKDVDRFDRWFGAPSSDAADRVRAIYERALSVATFQGYWCPVANSPELEWSVNDVAAAWPGNAPTEIFFAPYFFDLSATSTIRPGVIVHELTHLSSVGGTDDVVYGDTDAKALAQSDPTSARTNADNYRLYFEDVLSGN